MNWREDLKEAIGVTDEKDIVDLTDMEERELLGKEHLEYIAPEKKTDSDTMKKLCYKDKSV